MGREQVPYSVELQSDLQRPSLISHLISCPKLTRVNYYTVSVTESLLAQATPLWSARDMSPLSQRRHVASLHPRPARATNKQPTP